MTTPLPPIEALASRLDVAPAAVARAIIAAHITPPECARRIASGNPQSPQQATGATLLSDGRQAS
jgi:hypothetical protein